MEYTYIYMLQLQQILHIASYIMSSLMDYIKKPAL